jgi:hypothetical protein
MDGRCGRAQDASDGGAPTRGEIDAIQLNTLSELIQPSRASRLERAARRIQEDFVGRSFAEKVRFAKYAARIAAQLLRSRLKRQPKLPFIAEQLPTAMLHTGIEKPLKIAVSGTGSIGDFFNHMTFIGQFHETYGPMELDFFCRPAKVAHAQTLFGNLGLIRNVLSATYLDRLRDCYDLVIEIRHLPKYDVRNYKRLLEHAPQLLGAIGVAQERFGPFSHIFDRHPLLDGHFARQVGLKGMNALDVLGYYGNIAIDRNSIAPFRLNDAKRTVLNRFGLAGKPYISLHNGFDSEYSTMSSTATKCWPIEHWNTFVALLKRRRPDLLIVQVGAGNSQLISGIDVDLVDKTEIAEAPWILKGSILHIDGESGLVRMATAMGITSVVLFGPTSSTYFAYDQNINIVSKACHDCWWATQSWMSFCPRGLRQPECMHTISPDEVVEAAIGYLEHQGESSYGKKEKALSRVARL